MYKVQERSDFLQFMDELLEELANNDVATTTYHVVLDNYYIHKQCNEWLKTHPNVKFHYTSTSESRLNMIEIWFGILMKITIYSDDDSHIFGHLNSQTFGQ